MKVSVLIAETEPLAAGILRKYLLKFPGFELAGICKSVSEVYHSLQKQTIDLLFLNIQMPGLSGGLLIKNLRNPPCIIFTATQGKYALEGYELNAVDFLLKPVGFDRFLKCIDKVSMALERTFRTRLNIDPPADANPFLFLKIDRRNVKIRINDILYVESLRDYIKVNSKEQSYVSKQRISMLEGMLPDKEFLRIHRSYLVSLSKVDSYHSYGIRVNGHELPIGRNYKKEVYEKLKNAGGMQ